jgi:ubiquinone/menaquinone biosynthesis C-methylase UbiE
MLDATWIAEQQHFWFRGFRRFVHPFLVEATAGVAHASILDCGCGTGSNLGFLSQFGTAYGIDLTWRGLEFAHKKGCFRLARATVAALPFRAAVVDVATSFDVLYCLEDDVERRAIREMYRVLKPGGALIVNAAALDILKGDHSVLVHEVRRYTRRSLSEKLREAGFDVKRITYTNAALFPVTATVRAVQRLRGIKEDGGKRGDFDVPPPPVNAAFSAALGLEAALVGAGLNMPIGSSVLCLARKT